MRSADGTPWNVIVTIVGTNDAPVAQASSFTVAEDAAIVTGNVSATDIDTGGTLSYALNGAAPAGLTFNADGSYSFNPANAAYQSLGAGQQQVITVPYTVTDNAGASSTANLVITVTGTNDAAVVSGTSSGSITEDTNVAAGNLSTGGTLTVTDLDAGRAAFQPQASTAGTYGTFTLAANGAWTYTASNSNTAIQNLGAGQTLSETFTVRSADGTTSSVVVTINGTNDVAVISAGTGSVTEDVAVTAGNISTGGTLTVTDADSGRHLPAAGFHCRRLWNLHAGRQRRLDLHGLHPNTAIQSLGAGQTLTETFTVRSADGTTSSVVVTINGTNDVAVISAGTGSVTEDSGVVAGNISTGGTLTVTDADSGQPPSSRRLPLPAPMAPSRWPPTAPGPTRPPRTPRSSRSVPGRRSLRPSPFARLMAPRRASSSRSTARTMWR
ncbi:hypothetical protein FSC37_05340 [Piscinibacter aquaticus]|uniref:Cadherin domain-containing protein n=1 Tax=Piscinibacter aquaticus TaxID=392597 RepID=A0A5C6TYF8_9BURK|nr:hypothetical protein FSC37_05340 [Piscinibacter aquaticus]